MDAVFIDFNGELALDWGWCDGWDTPFQDRRIRMSGARTAEWADMVGRTIRPQDWQGNFAIIPIYDRQPITVDISNWGTVMETRPIPKPRAGRERGMKYDWEYRQGRWQKEWV